MELEWHVPDCVSVDPKPNLEFTTLEELVQAAECFKQDSFVEFTLDEIKYSESNVNRTIIATYDEGYRWWVVGFIINATQEEVDKLGLPKWKARYREEAKE